MFRPPRQPRGAICSSLRPGSGISCCQTILPVHIGSPFDEQADALPRLEQSGAGFVVVENVDYAASVVAVNYANSIGADLLIVAALTEDEPDQITHAILAYLRR